jgi:hypothetical protein
LVNHTNLGFVTVAFGAASPLNNYLLVGLANGDPGNWGMERSNGPKLLGISGDFGSRGQNYGGPGDTEYAVIDFIVPNTMTQEVVNVSHSTFWNELAIATPLPPFMASKTAV